MTALAAQCGLHRSLRMRLSMDNIITSGKM
jgi:hypothetical protein